MAHTYREQNRLADTLSEAATRGHLDVIPTFLATPPCNLLKVFWAVYFGMMYKRFILASNLRVTIPSLHQAQTLPAHGAVIL